MKQTATTTKLKPKEVTNGTNATDLPACKFEPPLLGDNITAEFLVDELGIARAWKKHYECLEGYYKQAITGRTLAEREPKSKRTQPKNIFNGELFTAIFEKRSRTGLDQARIREVMGDEWCKQFETTTDYTQITTKRR